jgi:predicted GIY-YIG superfamily endonuclease
MKICGHCKNSQDEKEFSKGKGRPDGLYPTCKTCQRAYREGRRELKAQKDKEYRENNKDKIKAQKKEYRNKDIEKTKRLKREEKLRNKETYDRYKREHQEELKNSWKHYYLKNREKQIKKAQVYAKQNKDKIAARNKKYQLEHPQKRREYRNLHRNLDRAYYYKTAEKQMLTKEKKRQWVVYKILFANGAFYLGSSCQAQCRFNAHKSLVRKDRHTKTLRGQNFEGAQLLTLSLCTSETEALAKEASFIGAEKENPLCLNQHVPNPPSKLYWVYVIQSLVGRENGKPGFYYVGMTHDPAQRLRAHNGEIKGGGKYTSQHRPWESRALYGPYFSRSEALKAEYTLKRQKRGRNRLAWTKKNSPLCCGEGPLHPWVKNPLWKPPTLDAWKKQNAEPGHRLP